MSSEKRKPAVTKRPATRKKSVHKKKSKPFPTQWKVAIAGLLLILLSPLYYGYILNGFVSTWRWIRDWGQDPNYRTYESFDIKIPKKLKKADL